MERNTFSILFSVRKSKARKNGSAPIETTITINGERARFSTGKMIPLDKWDKIKQQVKGKDEEAVTLNAFLKSIRIRLYEKEAPMKP